MIEADGLTKSYAGRVVLDSVSLTIDEGEVVAVLGPNGAGKTTLIEILEGFRMPDRGTARVFGVDPRRDRACKKVLEAHRTSLNSSGYSRNNRDRDDAAVHAGRSLRSSSRRKD